MGSRLRNASDRKNHVRSVCGVVMERLPRDHAIALAPQRLAGVGVWVELRIVRARDVDADPMSGHETIADWPDIYRDRVDLPGFHELLAIEAVAETHAQHAIGKVHRKAVGI